MRIGFPEYVSGLIVSGPIWTIWQDRRRWPVSTAGEIKQLGISRKTIFQACFSADLRSFHVPDHQERRHLALSTVDADQRMLFCRIVGINKQRGYFVVDFIGPILIDSGDGRPWGIGRIRDDIQVSELVKVATE
jgi:hypothetical protein